MANNKYLKRKFTTREIILLIVLFIVLFIGLYFALVYYPLRQANQDLDEQLAKADNDLVVAQTLKANYDRQKAAIEQFKENNTATMPKYNNNDQQLVLQVYYNGVLNGTTDLDFIWGNVNPDSADNGVLLRTVTFVFTVTEANVNDPATQSVYDRTIEILHTMMSNPQIRCSMSRLELSTENGSNLEVATSITVNTTIIFYELA